jgi:dihydrodipicolinate synthase/N-acetylneuraminate lyase
VIETRAIEGIVPVLLTPFDEDGNIDEPAQIRLVEFLCEKKIGGLWVLGTGSEDMNMSYEKRLQAAQIVTKAVNGRVPVVLGAGFFALEDTLNFMEDTADLEFDSYHVMPYHPLYSLDRLEWHYKHVADNSPKPVWMYTSANWCRAVPPEFVGRMKDHPNIAGMKYSSSNALHNTKVITMAEPGFQVITAVIKQLYPCLCLGSKAHTSSLGSAIPEPLIEIYDDFKAGRHENALIKQRHLNNFMDALPGGTSKDNFIKAADEKSILSLRGICDHFTSSYYRDTTEGEREEIENALNQFHMLR